MSERRDGDWECPECQENCFASKSYCYKCGTAKPGTDGGGKKGKKGKGKGGKRDSGKDRRSRNSGGDYDRPGDWDCPE